MHFACPEGMNECVETRWIMPKMKTRKSVAKRFKVTGTGKLRRTAAGGSHLLTGKSRKRKNSLHKEKSVSKADQKRLARCLQG